MQDIGEGRTPDVRGMAGPLWQDCFHSIQDSGLSRDYNTMPIGGNHWTRFVTDRKPGNMSPASVEVQVDIGGVSGGIMDMTLLQQKRPFLSSPSPQTWMSVIVPIWSVEARQKWTFRLYRANDFTEPVLEF